MRLRLSGRLHAFLRRRSTKGLIGLGLAAVALLALAGGGAYAALGGFSQPVTSNTIELQKGLVGWWKMQGNTKDTTPNSDNAVVSGPTLSADREGAANSAYTLNGSSDYMTIAPAAVLRPTTGISLSIWTKPSNIASTSEQKIVSTTESGGYVLFITGSSADVCAANQLGFVLKVGSGYAGACTSRTILTNGVWSHIAATFDGSNVRLYINGSLQATTAASGSISYTYTTIPVCIGVEATGTTCSTQNYGGAVSDMRIYNRAVSSGEVMALYKQYNSQVNAANGESGLVGWWKMQGNSKDATPYANNATATNGTPSLAADRKGASSSAYSLNGTNYFTAGTNHVPVGGSARTVTAWIKDSGSTYGAVLAINTASGQKWIPLTVYGGAWYVFTDGINSNNNVAMTNPPTGGAWHHVAFTMDASNNWAYYLDGQLKQSGTFPTAINTATAANVTIGTRTDVTGSLTATLSDVRLYNRSLSSMEVARLYNSYNSQISLDSSPTSNQAVNLNSGLIGYWPFNGNAKDATPYQNNGIVTGATLTTDRKGRANSAYSFNGTASNYISTTGQFSVPTNAVTVSAWINLISVTGNNMIVVKEPSNTQWELMTEGSNLRWVGGNGYNSSLYCSGMVAGVWYQVVGVQTGTSASLYRNGIQCANATQPAITNGTGNLDIGRYNGGYYLNGTIDDVRIYNRVLSPSEISALYNNYY